jgi:hypothetical protein
LTSLHRAFKEHHAISVPESHLRARLENFLDEARALAPGSYAQTASDYLAIWCGDGQLLLKKLYSGQVEEPVFELTSGAERAMQWIEDLQAKPFVSAESRLELILRNLEEIVLFSTSDVENRIANATRCCVSMPTSTQETLAAAQALAARLSKFGVQMVCTKQVLVSRGNNLYPMNGTAART